MKKKMFIPAVLLFTVLLLIKFSAGQKMNACSYRQISAEEAAAMMTTEKNYILLDVRTAGEYEESHIPGALNLPNENIGTEEIPELPDKNQLILIYCRSGTRSKQAAQKLVDSGYTNIVEFGGIRDWRGETVSGAL